MQRALLRRRPGGRETSGTCKRQYGLAQESVFRQQTDVRRGTPCNVDVVFDTPGWVTLKAYGL